MRLTRPPAQPPLRGRRQIAPAPRAGRAAADVVAKFSAQFGSSLGDISTRWTEIVGEKTAKMCTPVKLTGRGASGTLHVAAPGPAALLVDANAQQILQKVNTFCGRDVAKRLAIVRASARPGAQKSAGATSPGAAKPALKRAPAPGGLPPTAKLKLEAELEGIEDPRLKAALMKLGKGALQKRPGRAGEGG